jgi:hypothetical protein
MCLRLAISIREPRGNLRERWGMRTSTTLTGLAARPARLALHSGIAGMYSLLWSEG